jgi:osmotically-inducible protein OsmY
MIRGLIRLMLIALVVVAAAFFLFGYWSNSRLDGAPATADMPKVRIDTAAAREAGATVGEKTAIAASRIGESLGEGSLTAKIKAKMVLDDLVKARAIDVTTEGSTVTVAGTVHSSQERERALSLARETSGVTKVVDALVVR